MGWHPFGVRCYLVRFPVVSLVDSLDHRLQAGIPPGCEGRERVGRG